MSEVESHGAPAFAADLPRAAAPVRGAGACLRRRAVLRRCQQGALRADRQAGAADHADRARRAAARRAVRCRLSPWPTSPRARATIVNVFASWCAPCRVEHPFLVALADAPAVKQGKVAVVGMNYKDEAENARRFLGALGNPYSAVGVDRTGRGRDRMGRLWRAGDLRHRPGRAHPGEACRAAGCRQCRKLLAKAARWRCSGWPRPVRSCRDGPENDGPRRRFLPPIRLSNMPRPSVPPVERIDQVLGMRHQAEHVEAWANRCRRCRSASRWDWPRAVTWPCASA